MEEPTEKQPTAAPAGAQGTSTSTRPSCALGLDLATRTGWAVTTRMPRLVPPIAGSPNFETPMSGFWDLKPERGQSPGMRYLKLRGFLVQALRMLVGSDGKGGLAEPELIIVAYEQTVMHGGQQAAELALGCVAVVQEVCAVLEVQHATVYPSTLKKWATGSGRADKAAMVAAAKPFVRPSREPLDHNEADAIHVARWAYERFCT